MVNLNKDASKVTTDYLTGNTETSGEMWPGITDLDTLNEASSLLNEDTPSTVKVSVVLSDNNLNAEIIYVCYDQTVAELA